jgi:hypothetical protein
LDALLACAEPTDRGTLSAWAFLRELGGSRGVEKMGCTPTARGREHEIER